MLENILQCLPRLSKITILIDLIRQRAVWSLRINKNPPARALVLRIARRHRPPVPSPSRTPSSPRSTLARRRCPALCYTTVATAAALPYPIAPPRPPCPRRRLPRRPPLPSPSPAAADSLPFPAHPPSPPLSPPSIDSRTPSSAVVPTPTHAAAAPLPQPAPSSRQQIQVGAAATQGKYWIKSCSGHNDKVEKCETMKTGTRRS
ncbi:hypothetical protein PVAP13_7NG290201 [Panicum virgatum]|uniref:Uncharacterized protein n=1 Tax=Panicum virgatum TaxID=38727 RepID=A0A8T0QDX8_PANVG|nr:hypothetical protein PVAP13_7NG290201 [Panicum virgatum]KAG2568434.1 hypothetical protein PVAP13_7NG290201 [Panicum virgatum]